MMWGRADIARAVAYRWATKFGLTPADRAAIEVASAETGESLADRLFEEARAKLEAQRDGPAK